MLFWTYKETSGDTCEGATIGSVMYDLSEDLYEGCKYNAHLAVNAEKIYQIRSANMSSIFFSISAVEAKLNELITFYASCGSDDSIWNQVLNHHQRKPTSEKWNLIVDKTGGRKWDHLAEPFKSFNLIKGLRNELVHYKGEPLEKDETPNRKIQIIMDTLGVKSEATFMEDDCSAWINDLLNCKELANLVVSSISPVFENMNEYLGHELFKPES